MKSFVVAAFVLFVGCTRPNPDFCCATEQQCEALSSDSIRPCEAGQACTNAGTCVASECADSGDCTDPNSPVCIGNLCVAACTQDDDCNGAPGPPHCAPDGACVGCVDASQCSGETNICDADTRACRGCEHDSECAGGVCLEADGVCKADADVVFVTQFGSSDTGTCTRQAPCATFTYAMSKVTAGRPVLHIDGGNLQLPTSTYTFDRNAYIDGTNTNLGGTASGMAAFDTSAATVTLSGVTITHGADVAIRAGATGTLRVFNSMVGEVYTDGGTVQAKQTSAAPGGGYTCENGTLTVTASSFTDAHVNGINCQVRVSTSRFHGCNNCIYARGGFASIENNVTTTTDGLSDSTAVVGVAPGSVFRFNTIVNTTSVPSDGVALNCDQSVEVSSNIFAYRSQHPHPPAIPCMTRYSLYDETAVSSETVGQGNKVGPLSTFFVDLPAGDFHLSQASPARDSAEPGLDVPRDVDGTPRSAMPDMGAFEAP